MRRCCEHVHYLTTCPRLRRGEDTDSGDTGRRTTDPATLLPATIPYYGMATIYITIYRDTGHMLTLVSPPPRN